MQEVEKMKAMFAILMVAALFFAGCAGTGASPSAPAPPSPGNDSVPVAPPPGLAVREFTVEASQWQFSPGTITVNTGDRVKITLVSKDVAHGFALPDFGFDLKVGAGQTESGEFTAGKAGTFTFFCNVPCGEGHPKMKGTLIVN